MCHGGAGASTSLHRPSHTRQFQLRSDRWRGASSWYRKKRRWSRKRWMTAQMYNSFIHHPSLFSSHQSKPTKSLASPLLSGKMSSVGARLRHCRREKGQILCVHFDFLDFCLSSTLEMGQLKRSHKGGSRYLLAPVTLSHVIVLRCGKKNMRNIGNLLWIQEKNTGHSFYIRNN